MKLLMVTLGLGIFSLASAETPYYEQCNAPIEQVLLQRAERIYSKRNLDWRNVYQYQRPVLADLRTASVAGLQFLENLTFWVVTEEYLGGEATLLVSTSRDLEGRCYAKFVGVISND